MDSGYFERTLLADQKRSPLVSIGVLLCKSKDDEIVEYAMSRNISPTLVADY